MKAVVASLFALALICTSCADVVVTVHGTTIGRLVPQDSLFVGVETPTRGTVMHRLSDIVSVQSSDPARIDTLRALFRGTDVRVSLASDEEAVRTRLASAGRVDYESDKKEPAMAGLLSVLMPSLGHAYAGDPGRGVGFFVAEVVEGAAGWYLLERVGNNATLSDTVRLWGELAGLAVVVLGVATKVGECHDAIHTADAYNAELAKRLGLEIGLLPARFGLNAGLSFRF